MAERQRFIISLSLFAGDKLKLFSVRGFGEGFKYVILQVSYIFLVVNSCCWIVCS